MKKTGILRRVDELGRIVIPIEIRNHFGIAEKDALEIYVNNSAIILKKHESECIFCGEKNNLIEYDSKLICENCSHKIASLSKEKNND